MTLLLLIPFLVAVAAGCGTQRPGHQGASSHGKVVAYLPIPYQVNTEADTGAPRTIRVMVRSGHLFAVKVATSDGPFVWRQVGPPPDRRVVRFAGDVDAGHCPKTAAGCRVPYFHVLRARATGTTAMTWLYRARSCAARTTTTQATRPCVATVTFQITVR